MDASPPVRRFLTLGGARSKPQGDEQQQQQQLLEGNEGDALCKLPVAQDNNNNNAQIIINANNSYTTNTNTNIHDDNNDHNKEVDGLRKTELRRPLRLVLRTVAPQAKVVAAVNVNGPWWPLLAATDSAGLFHGNADFISSFKAALGDGDGAYVNAFYQAMSAAFASWRRQWWAPWILCQDPQFSSNSNNSNSDTKKEERIARQAHYAKAALARWYEGLRTQRIVAQQLLLYTDDDDDDDVVDVNTVIDNDDANTGSSGKASWRYELACSSACQRIASHMRECGLGGDAVDDFHLVRSLRPRARQGLSGYLVLQAPDGRDVAVVPSRQRVLLLLRVLDDVWGHASSEAFRLPVQEWTAPGYYRKIKDAVSLAALYEYVLDGTVSPIPLNAGAPYATANAAASSSSVSVVEEYPLHYVALRERLMVMRNNCFFYNGAGSPFSTAVEEVVNYAAKVIRDAQAQEDDESKYATHIRKLLSLEMQRDGPRAAGLDIPTVQPLTMEELKERFPLNAMARQPLEMPSSGITNNNKKKASPSEAEQPMASTSSKKNDNNNKTKRELLEGVVPPASGTRVLRLGRPTLDAAENTRKEEEEESPKPKPRRGRRPKTATEEEGKEEEVDADGNTVYWICCDKCEEWRVLPTRIHPAPPYWECAYMGIACDAAKVLSVAEANKNKKQQPLKRGRKPRAEREDNNNNNAAERINRDEDDIPLIEQFTATTTSVAAPRRGRKPGSKTATRQAKRSARKEEQQGAAGLLDSSEDSASSSSSSDSSSSSSDSDSDSSHSGSSSSSSSAPTDRRLRGMKAADGGKRSRKRERSRRQRGKKSTAKRKDRKHKTHTASAHHASPAVQLEALEERFGPLEAMPVSEDPFKLLEELRRLEKELDVVVR